MSNTPLPGPRPEGPDHGRILRTRLYRVIVAHLLTLGVFDFCVCDGTAVVRFAGAAILALLSTFAFVSSLSLSPDPEKGNEWWSVLSSASAWTKKWVCGGLYVLWLVLLAGGKGGAVTVALGYLAVALVVAFFGFEGEATYRSRKGLPPAPPKATVPLPPGARHFRTRVIRAAAFHAAVLLFLVVYGSRCDDHLQALVESVVLTPLALAALSASLSLSPDPARTRPWWNPIPRGTRWVRALGYVGFFLATAITLRVAGEHPTGTCVVYALAAGLLSYRWSESVDPVPAEPTGAPARDDIADLIEAYDDGRLDRDEFERELAARAARRAPPPPRRTIDPD